MRRDWSLVNVKRAEQRRLGCRVCGRCDRPLEAAHIVDRQNDPRIRRSKVIVDPDLVVLLCGPFPEGCHGAYDAHELDLSEFLTEREVRAAIAAVGEGPAMRRICGRASQDGVPGEGPAGGLGRPVD